MSTLLFGLAQPGVKARLWSDLLNHTPRSTENCWDERFSGTDGSIGFQAVPIGPTSVFFTKDGYQDVQFDTVMPDDGAHEIRLVPNAPQALHRDGWDLRYADGTRYVHNQATNYLLFQRFLQGEDIAPLLYDGFNGYNVTFLMSIVPAQAGMQPLRPEGFPQFYDKANTFFDYLAQRGKRCEATLLCDCDQLGYTHSMQVTHTERMYDIIRTKSNVLCQLGNEVEKNGIDYGTFAKPNGVLWSRGSSLAGGPCPLPAGDYSTAHLGRSGGGAYLDAQPFYMVDGYTGYAGTKGPVITNETRGASNTENTDRRSTDPNYFRRIASASRGWSGMTFHADFGIHSDVCVPGSVQDNCRLAFLEGINDGRH